MTNQTPPDDQSEDDTFHKLRGSYKCRCGKWYLCMTDATCCILVLNPGDEMEITDVFIVTPKGVWIKPNDQPKTK